MEGLRVPMPLALIMAAASAGPTYIGRGVEYLHQHTAEVGILQPTENG